MEKLGKALTQLFLKYMPNTFVFALLITIITAVIAIIWLGSSPMDVITFWYKGFFDLLGFAMQIILLIVTGFSIALSPRVRKVIDKLTKHIKTPAMVYVLVILFGMLLSWVSFGWIVITCVFARELAKRVEGIHYPFLIACTYISGGSWVMGLSSSIPLLLNSENNFLIEAGLLETVIPTSFTLQSSLNIVLFLTMFCLVPLTMLLLKPNATNGKELKDLLLNKDNLETKTIKEEADSLKLPFDSWSDSLNNSKILQQIIVLIGLVYIGFHFSTRGFDLNFNIMIFTFLIIGLLLHGTPMRYVISMQRSCSNISGIVFQYPFYAGIMGIMLYTGFGEKLGEVMASLANVDTYPFYSFLTGALANFAIPSAGGEFAVIGPSLIPAIKELGSGLSQQELTAMITRGSMAVAYGESLSNMLQPFYLLLVLPVMGKGVQLQARDIMGYLAIPFFIFFIVQSFFVVFWPL